MRLGQCAGIVKGTPNHRHIDSETSEMSGGGAQKKDNDRCKGKGCRPRLSPIHADQYRPRQVLTRCWTRSMGYERGFLKHRGLDELHGPSRDGLL